MASAILLGMIILTSPITRIKLRDIAKNLFGNLVKAVVDIDKEQMVIDAELHADEEALLLKSGSKQKNLWGINLYPDLVGDDFIEFDSMINLRPSIGNNSRGINDQLIRDKIIKIVHQLISE